MKRPSTNRRSNGRVSAEQGKTLQTTTEKVANKATDFSTVNDTKYPSVQAVRNYVRDIGLDTPITELNNHSLREVFEGEYAVLGVGKNLFDGDFTNQTVGLTFIRLSATQFKIERIGGDTGIDTVNLFPNIKFLPATQYTFSGSHFEIDDSKNLRFNIRYTDGTNTVFVSPDTVDTAFSLTSTAGKTISLITYTYSSPGGITTYTNFQLEQGTVATTYEPYRSTLNNDLPPFVHWFGLEDLGIDTLTVEQMDYWYGVYDAIKKRFDNLRFLKHTL